MASPASRNIEAQYRYLDEDDIRAWATYFAAVFPLALQRYVERYVQLAQ